MHNCKTTRERITELLLNGVDARPAELLECSECRSEFDSIKETLRITKRQIDATVPPERFWNQYHQKLQQKLSEGISHADQVVTPSLATRAAWLSRMFASSIRVPVPVAAAVLLVVGLAFFFNNRRSPQEILPAQTVSVVHVPVEVPVIQEKVVTRVVYRKAKRRTSVPGSNQNVDDSTVAKSQKANLPSLDGFKPLDDVKLTVIKGGSPDEK
jgi:hypothetical protein